MLIKANTDLNAETLPNLPTRYSLSENDSRYNFIVNKLQVSNLYVLIHFG